jgi:hypothetical protein
LSGFLEVYELALLRFAHILAMVYWLGGEWAVFQTSYKVVDPALPVAERVRHLDTVFRIDVVSRIGIISLLPLGLHMGHLWGVQPYGGNFLVAVWLGWVAWVIVTLLAFRDKMRRKDTVFGKLEDWSRYLAIPAVIGTGITSLLGMGPFEAGDGQQWYSAKLIVFGLSLIVGLVLRYYLHEWPGIFARLAKGPDAAAEARLADLIRSARIVAVIYWITIGAAGFLGAVKPI